MGASQGTHTATKPATPSSKGEASPSSIPGKKVKKPPLPLSIIPTLPPDHPAHRNPQLRGLKPWKKGETSPIPSRRNLKPLTSLLTEFMDVVDPNPKINTDPTNLKIRKQLLIDKMWELCMQGDLEAIKYLWARLEGQLPQSLHLNAVLEKTEKLDLSLMPKEKLEALAFGLMAAAKRPTALEAKAEPTTPQGEIPQ